jgi:hypothetical protein
MDRVRKRRQSLCRSSCKSSQIRAKILIPRNNPDQSERSANCYKRYVLSLLCVINGKSAPVQHKLPFGTLLQQGQNMSIGNSGAQITQSGIQALLDMANNNMAMAMAMAGVQANNITGAAQAIKSASDSSLSALTNSTSKASQNAAQLFR